MFKEEIPLDVDSTRYQVGENGAVLSGGQRQRISLARALYFNGEILLLDDPLSGVDSRVGNQIFHNAILEARRAGKTVVWVTYDRRFLSYCDRVLYMHEGNLVPHEGMGVQRLSIRDLDQSFVLVESETGAMQGAERSTPKGKGPGNGVGSLSSSTPSSRLQPKKATPRECRSSLNISSAHLTEELTVLVFRTYIHAARGITSVPTLTLATVFMQTCQIIGSRSLVWWQFECVIVQSNESASVD